MSRIWLGLLALLCAKTTLAFDFSSADASFKNRGDNILAIASAKTSYRQALNKGSKEEKIYAAQQLGRLAYYEGELLLGEKESKKRVKLFDECMNDMEHISPKVVGKTATYYLYKAMCLALWGQSKGLFSAAARVGELKALIKDGLSLEGDYEGGGLQRLYAAVYIKSRLAGLYDLEGALKHVDRALELGPNYYNNHWAKANVLKEMGKKDEAIKILNMARSEIHMKIQTNKLPAGLEPETKLIFKHMGEKLEQMAR